MFQSQSLCEVLIISGVKFTLYEISLHFRGLCEYLSINFIDKLGIIEIASQFQGLSLYLSIKFHLLYENLKYILNSKVYLDIYQLFQIIILGRNLV